MGSGRSGAKWVNGLFAICFPYFYHHFGSRTRLLLVLVEIVTGKLLLKVTVWLIIRAVHFSSSVRWTHPSLLFKGVFSPCSKNSKEYPHFYFIFYIQPHIHTHIVCKQDRSKQFNQIWKCVCQGFQFCMCVWVVFLKGGGGGQCKHKAYFKLGIMHCFRNLNSLHINSGVALMITAT